MKNKITELYEKGLINIPRVCFKELLLEINEHDNAIRNKAIDDFAEQLLKNAPKNYAGSLELGGMTCYLSANQVKKIAKQLKH